MLRLLSNFTVAFLLLPAVFAQDEKPESEPRSIDQLIAAVVSTESNQVWEAYHNLFAAVGKDELAALQRHSDTSISIQAAWQHPVGTLTGKERGHRPHDKQALSRFVGFVEGRTRVAIPKWWADFVVKGPVEAKQNWYHNAGQRFVFAPNDTRITEKAGTYTLHIVNDSVELPDSILQRKTDNGDLSCRLSGLFTKDRCLIAIHGDVGFPHNVACVNRSTGKLVWVTEACGCWIGGASGVHESWVTVTVQDDQVVIFGASWAGFYMHSFDANTGKSRFRFSTLFGTA